MKLKEKQSCCHFYYTFYLLHTLCCRIISWNIKVEITGEGFIDDQFTTAHDYESYRVAITYSEDYVREDMHNGGVCLQRSCQFLILCRVGKGIEMMVKCLHHQRANCNAVCNSKSIFDFCVELVKDGQVSSYIIRG